MNAVVSAEQVNLPAPVARRGITEAQWRTLVNNLFPGAKSESVIMVWDYCAARRLDPMKKPCHIVPMQVKNQDGDYVWRDVVMPGIYEYRTTATRTGLYLGHSKPEYGPEAEHLGVKAPEYCELTVYRWSEAAKARIEFPVRIYFRECAATRKDKKTGEIGVNDRWSKAPIQMLTKCTEAAALREAFPDELGGSSTAEEMEGQTAEAIKVTDVTSTKADPRPDTSGVDWEVANQYVSDIASILSQDKDEYDIADELRDVNAKLSALPELYSVVFDKLASEGIITKANFRKYIGLTRRDS